MTPGKLRRFDHSVELFRSSHRQKLTKAPVRLFRTAALGLASRFLKKGIKVNAQIWTGANMTVVLPEEVSTALYRYGFYEEGLTRTLAERVSEGMTFFDIGAHFGYYTLMASSLVGSTGQVHSFEPTPRTFDILKLNTNSQPNIKINQMAMSSSNGIACFNDLGLMYSGRNSLYQRKTVPNFERMKLKTYEVQTLTIDGYCKEMGISPDFVKIDAESAELEILQGMSNVMVEKRPVITLEVGDTGIEGLPLSRDVVTFMIN
jgi:FkbM family methyltransferase